MTKPKIEITDEIVERFKERFLHHCWGGPRHGWVWSELPLALDEALNASEPEIEVTEEMLDAAQARVVTVRPSGMRETWAAVYRAMRKLESKK